MNFLSLRIVKKQYLLHNTCHSGIFTEFSLRKKIMIRSKYCFLCEEELSHFRIKLNFSQFSFSKFPRTFNTEKLSLYTDFNFLIDKLIHMHRTHNQLQFYLGS